MYQMSSAQILVEAADWAGTSPNARNEIFNITNGDTFRWQHMWPKIAKMFDMDYPDPIPCLHPPR
jgi:nucleoside-diphosphate-sugar epimerase